MSYFDFTIVSRQCEGKRFIFLSSYLLRANMLDQTHFHAYADATLLHLHDQLEQAFDDGDLEDLDYDEGAGILSIVTPDGHTFIASKHAPSGQLWLASPISGGLHFDFDDDTRRWVLDDGRTINGVLADNLRETAGLQVVL